MYIPKINEFNDHTAQVAFMQKYNFATVVSAVDGSIAATHIPLTLSTDNDVLRLQGHFARANKQWEALSNGEILAIFTEPHAYISPQHYEKTESVPTWNYIAVHAYGTAKLIHFEDDPAQLEAILEQLIVRHEAAYLQQWNGLPARFREGLMRGIVGFEVTVTRLEGKAKLSQNKTPDEQRSIIEELMQSEDSQARSVAGAMQTRLKS